MGEAGAATFSQIHVCCQFFFQTRQDLMSSHGNANASRLAVPLESPMVMVIVSCQVHLRNFQASLKENVISLLMVIWPG